MARRLQAAADEFTVSNGVNAYYFDPHMAALADGGFVVTWYDLFKDSLMGRRFDANGVPLGSGDFTIAKVDYDASGFDVAALTGGGFVFSWIDYAAGTKTPQLKIQIYDAAGAPSGTPILGSTASISSVTWVPTVTGLAGGGFVVVHEGNGAGELAGRIFDSAGQPVGPELQLSSSPFVSDRTPILAALPSGGFAMAWGTVGAGYDIQIRLFDSAGAPLGPEIAVAATSAMEVVPQLTVLSNGGLVVTWNEKTAAGWDIRARVFDSAGNPTADSFLVGPSGITNSQAASVSALANGEFAIAWPGSGGLDIWASAIKAQVFDSAGQKIGDEVTLNSAKAGYQFAPQLSTLADGSLAAVWMSRDLPFPAPILGLRVKILDLVQVSEASGGSGADNFTGTAVPNDYQGLGGNDFIDGGAGDDVLLGGDGLDTVRGGAGDDRLDGGGDADTLDGGGGDDLVVGGTGDDVLRYTHSDSAQGGFDRLEGGAGNDRFEVATTGNWTSSGAQLIGGDGDDLFDINWDGPGPSYYDAGIILDAGPGNDRIELKTVNTMAKITLGAGADTVALMTPSYYYSYYDIYTFGNGGGLDLSDFQPGAGGDRIEIQRWIERYLAYSSWDGETSPIAAGFMKLEQQGADTVLLIRSRLEYDFSRLIIFRNVQASAFTAYNLDGIPPDGSPIPPVVLTGSDAGERLDGGIAGDTLDGRGGNDQIYGWGGADTLRGGAGDDQIYGLGGNDLLEGEDGLDILDGGEGDDTLRGGFGNDDLRGNNGNDYLDGGPGADYMDGGSGDDVYVVDNPGDRIAYEYDYFGYGNDEVRTTLASYALPTGPDANFEKLTAGDDNPHELTGNEIGNLITGGAGADKLNGLGGNDLLDGRGGADVLKGGTGNDVYLVGDATDVIIELVGEGGDEVRTTLTTYTLPANVDFLTYVGTSTAQTYLRGNSEGNLIVGGAGVDVIDLRDGGNDFASGGAGNDGFLFGAALSSGDGADGGAGTNDQVILQGDYSALTVLPQYLLVNSEVLSLLSGSDTVFGGPGTDLFSYNLKTVDANVAAGARLTVDFTNLVVGENVTFDGSAETDGAFTVGGGKGVDHLTGGAGADLFLFRDEGRYGASDTVDGGAGTDELALRGNYSGGNAIVFQAATMVNIEVISILSGNSSWWGPVVGNFSYDLKMHDNNVPSGKRLVVDAGQLTSGEVLKFDGSAESDGFFVIAGGAAADTIIGGAGNDTLIGNRGADMLTGGLGSDSFRYRSVSESTAAAPDHILDFTSGDRIDFSLIDADSRQEGDQAFLYIGGNAFSGQAGELQAINTGGNLWTVSGDVDGDGNADFQILVTVADGHLLVPPDFLL